MSYHHAKGHHAGKANSGSTTKHEHFGPFQDHPHTPKGVTFEKPQDP